MTAKKIITTGDKFHRLTAVEEVAADKWLCLCDCGKQKIVTHRRLRTGDTKSCGCLLTINNKSRTHGQTTANNGGRTPVYRVWRAMMDRCYRQKNKSYKHYGARGITVCENWHSFDAFYADMGDAPKGLTLDRKDNNLSYSKDNCQWATTIVQNRNRRSTRMIEYNGEIKPLGEWAEAIGIRCGTLRHRIDDLNWPVEKAVTVPTLSNSTRQSWATKNKIPVE